MPKAVPLELPFPLGHPQFFAATPARNGARNVERVFTTERLAVALDTSITYGISSAPTFSYDRHGWPFLKGIAGILSWGRAVFRQF
jgi:hypothetical protein